MLEFNSNSLDRPAGVHVHSSAAKLVRLCAASQRCASVLMGMLTSFGKISLHVLCCVAMVPGAASAWHRHLFLHPSTTASRVPFCVLCCPFRRDPVGCGWCAHRAVGQAVGNSGTEQRRERTQQQRREGERSKQHPRNRIGRPTHQRRPHRDRSNTGARIALRSSPLSAALTRHASLRRSAWLTRRCLSHRLGTRRFESHSSALVSPTVASSLRSLSPLLCSSAPSRWTPPPRRRMLAKSC